MSTDCDVNKKSEPIWELLIQSEELKKDVSKGIAQQENSVLIQTSDS